MGTTNDDIIASDSVDDVTHGRLIEYAGYVATAQVAHGVVDDDTPGEVSGCTVTSDYVGVSSDRVAVAMPLLGGDSSLDRRGHLRARDIALLSAQTGASTKDFGDQWLFPTTLHVDEDVQAVLPQAAVIESASSPVVRAGDGEWSADGSLNEHLVALDTRKATELQHASTVGTILFGALVGFLFAIPRLIDVVWADLTADPRRRWTVRGLLVYLTALIAVFAAAEPVAIAPSQVAYSSDFPNRWSDDPSAAAFVAFGLFALVVLTAAGWWCGRGQRGGRTFLAFGCASWLVISGIRCPTSPAVLESWIFGGVAMALAMLPGRATHRGSHGGADAAACGVPIRSRSGAIVRGTLRGMSP